MSEESVELVDKKICEHNPELIAIELDYHRLQALESGDRGSSSSLFLKLIKIFQERIGKKTGVMPGKEMLHAYNKGLDSGADIALIDQDIRVTLNRIKNIRRKEKFKAALSLIAGMFYSKGLDPAKLPEKEHVQNMLEEFKEEYPMLNRILIEERNAHMASALRELQEKNPESEIVAFVGAGHREGLEEALNL